MNVTNSLEIALFSAYSRLRKQFEAFVESDSWAFQKTSLWLCLGCILVSFPNYDYFIWPNDLVRGNWDALEAQAQHPFIPVQGFVEEHKGQLAFRLLLPLVAHIGHFHIGWFFAGLPIVAWSFFTLLLKTLRSANLTPWASLLIVTGLSATYLGKSFFVDVLGYFDAYCFFLLLLALRTQSRLWSMAVLFAALFVDERAFVAAPFVALCRFYLNSAEPLSIHSRMFWAESISIALVVLAGLLIRYWLGQQFGLQSGMESRNLGFETLRSNFIILPLGYLSGLDGWILMAALPAYYLYSSRQMLMAAGFVILILSGLVALGMVLDLTRCLAYMFPAVLAGILALLRHESKAFVEKTLTFFCGLSLVFPPLFVVGEDIVWMAPIVPKVFRIAAQAALGLHI